MRPVLSPVMEIVQTAASVDLAGVAALAFTSANGVRALAAADMDERRAKDILAFAVGRATEAAARAAGFARVETADGDVGSLAALIAGHHRANAFEGDVLHVAGTDRAGDLVALLKAEAAPARREAIYKARALPELSGAARAALAAAQEGRARVLVAFFSPRSARLFLAQAGRTDVLPALASAEALCLSAAVADSARDATWREIHVAETQTSESLVALAAEAIGRFPA